MKNNIDYTKEAYDKIAEDYCKKFVNEIKDKPLETKLMDLFTERCDKKGTELDLGCGPGEFTDYLFKKGLKKITGIDLSEGMINEAKKKYPKINFQLGNMLNLENIKDRSVCGVFSFYSIIHFNNEQLIKAIKEMHRMMKKSSYILLAFHINSGKYSGVYHADKMLDKEVNLDYYFFDSDFVADILEKTGFEITERIIRYHYKNVVEGDSDRSIIFAKKK